jgi:hypothetical protein
MSDITGVSPTPEPMMGQIYTDAALAQAVSTERWSALAELQTDIATLKTWDKRLSRKRRILVPIDVQALVVALALPGQPVGQFTDGFVRVAGTRGDAEPFSATSARPAGIHLHWALPDALLRAAPRVEGDTALRLPKLPDRWVVVRTLLPIGGSKVHVTGWVVDATKGSVSKLSDFSGNTPDAAAGTPNFNPLDGSSGGTLLWSATYDGATNRFALHDDLGDLPGLTPIAPRGFHANRACYCVAGWWSDESADIFGGAQTRSTIQRLVNNLGWSISEDSIDHERNDPPPPKHSAKPTPNAFPKTTTYSKYGVAQHQSYADVSPAASLAVASIAEHIVVGNPNRYLSLLHGCVLSVPLGGPTGADDRPSAGGIETALGLDLDDVLAALASPAFGTNESRRQSAERLMAAFTSGLLDRIATPDGLRDIEEREHADGFWSFPGKSVPAARDDRLRTDDSLSYSPLSVGRKGRASHATARNPKATTQEVVLEARLEWGTKAAVTSGQRSGGAAAAATRQATSRNAKLIDASATIGESRTVTKPGPRMYRPSPPIVGLRGAKPHSRHHHDRFIEGMALRLRWPWQCTPAVVSVVDPIRILPTIGSGAVPSEVLRIVQETVLLDPFATEWLAKAGAPEATWPQRLLRLDAERIRMHGPDNAYDGSGVAAAQAALRPAVAAPSNSWAAVSAYSTAAAYQLSGAMASFSLYLGTLPSPVGVTNWRQPWVPLHVEWRVRVVGTSTCNGWRLGDLDLEADLISGVTPPPNTVDRTFSGRAPISTFTAGLLTNAMQGWITAEAARDAATPSQSTLSEPEERQFEMLRDLIAPMDLVSVSLDGIREQLLGIEYVAGSIVREILPGGTTRQPAASQLPVPLFGGTFELQALRIVDAFGRVLEVPVSATRTTQSLEVPAKPATIFMRPRVQHGARWLFRLIDPAHALDGDPLAAPEAYVDQLAGENSVTPVSGYLLPDHMDESVEVFDRFGNSMGELIADGVSDAVMWEPAPGRKVPPDAGPLIGIPEEFGQHAQHAALLAAGIVRADIDARHSVTPPSRSTLSALLQAIDTTLWSIDTFQALGSSSIAGLVGRPVAIVRATLRLDIPDDIDEVNITHAGGADARRNAFAALTSMDYAVRIGDLGRTDDSVLGFFVDDDYSTFHVVDKVVEALRRDVGRHRGHLGLLGATGGVDAQTLHPFISAQDTLLVRPGQVVRLTVLMLPAGKIHLTSGIVPRKSLALAEDWVSKGMAKIVPSVRVGPVLVDPAEIRMPKVASLGDKQSFIRRTGPLSWKEDPIVSATSAAYLPKIPHEIQEGWIRVTPKPETKDPT